MEPRLKVLMSAYACEPGKGSEPEVGWQWALQMARFHSVTVLTRTNNQTAIERGLSRLPSNQPKPAFHYHDLGSAALRSKRVLGTRAYYERWQRSAVHVVRQLHSLHHFDLLHHVSFASFRHSAAVFGHGVPCIWGPVGGVEPCPWALLPWSHPPSLLRESLRNLNNAWHRRMGRSLEARMRQATQVLVTTPAMETVVQELGHTCHLVPSIGMHCDTFQPKPQGHNRNGLKLLFVGNIIALKGLDFAVRALTQAGPETTLTIVGEGNYTHTLRKLARSMGITEKVIFKGRLQRQAVMDLYREFDVFLFPSLHDTGGYAVLEAMSEELPVICLDAGGPAVTVSADCGIKVALGSRPQVVLGLADALRCYENDRELMYSHGKAARKRVLEEYDWNLKGERLNQIYTETVMD